MHLLCVILRLFDLYCFFHFTRNALFLALILHNYLIDLVKFVIDKPLNVIFIYGFVF